MPAYYRFALPERTEWDRDKEIKLFQKAKTSKAAHRKFVEMFLLLAASLGLKTAAGRLSNEDAITAANQGLEKAILRWDPTRGVRFSTFCGKYIRGEVLSAIRKRARESVVFCSLEQLSATDYAEVMEKMTVPPSTGWEMFVKESGGRLEELVSKLSAADQRVLHKRFFQNMTYEEIAKRSKPVVSRQAIKDQIDKIIARLRRGFGPRWKRK